MGKRAATAATVILAATALAACGSSSSSSSSGSGSLKGKQATFVIFDTGQQEQFAKAFVDPVEAKTGLDVTFDAPTDYAKLQAQVQSGSVTWTTLEADPWWAEGHCGKLIERINVKVPGSPPNFPSGPCGTPGDTFAFIDAYNSDQFKSNPPSSWADFFNTSKYPGKRAIWGSYALNGALEGALLADGVSPSDLYPLDVNRALDKLATIKSDLVFYDQPGQAVQMMESGDVAFAIVPSTQGYDQAQAGGSFKPIWNQALLSWDSYIVPKGADTAAAKALLNQIAKPEAQATLAEQGSYGVTNPNAKPKLNGKQLEWSPSGSIGGKSNQSEAIPFGQSYYAKHSDQVIQAWTNFVSG